MLHGASNWCVVFDKDTITAHCSAIDKTGEQRDSIVLHAEYSLAYQQGQKLINKNDKNFLRQNLDHLSTKSA